jgi:type II secretory pathway component PulF
MVVILLIGFIICFLGGLLPCFVLTYKDATTLLRKKRHDYFWETVVTLVFGICLAGVSIAGIIAIAIALNKDIEPKWLDAVILCTLPLSVGANVRFLLEMD